MNELLTRSMDLIHTKNGSKHILKFDTSYPVKVAGYIIKTFKAVADYKENDSFELYLDQTGTDVISIPASRVYGWREMLSKNDYFKTGDCVMAIIECSKALEGGSIRICNLSPVGDTANEGLYLTYKCNGIDDTEKLQEIINMIYNATGEIEVMGVPVAPINRDITIDIVGRLGLGTPTVTQSLVDRERRLSYVKISPTVFNVFFNIHLKMEKCAIGNGGTKVKADMDANNLSDVITAGKPGLRAFLIDCNGGAGSYKLFIDSARFEENLLSILFVSNESFSIGSDISQNVTYVELNNLRYTDGSEDNGATPLYSLNHPMPIICDNYSRYAEVVFNNLSVSGVKPARNHLCVNSGEMFIDGLNLYFAEEAIYHYNWCHMYSTCDSLFVNGPKAFNSHNGKLYSDPSYDIKHMSDRYVETDVSADFGNNAGYIYDDYSMEDIGNNVPKLTIINSTMVTRVHNVVTNIGGELVFKNNVVDAIPAANCNENSIIMTFSGNIIVTNNEVNIDCSGNNLNGFIAIYVFPLSLESIKRTSGRPPEYVPADVIAGMDLPMSDILPANMTCESNKFFVDKEMSQAFMKPVVNFNGAITDYMKKTIKNITYIFNIHSYNPYNIYMMGAKRNDKPIFVNSGLIRISDCDYSCSYDMSERPDICASSTPNTAKELIIESCIESGYNTGLLCGVVVLFNRGGQAIEFSNCTCGMNGISDGTVFSNCPTYGLISYSNHDNGSLHIANSNIRVCMTPVINETEKSEDFIRFAIQAWVEQLDPMPEEYQFTHGSQIVRGDTIGLLYNASQYGLNVIVDNTTLESGMMLVGALKDDADSADCPYDFDTQVSTYGFGEKGYFGIKGVNNNADKIYVGLSSNKIRSARFTNVQFKCGEVMIQPVSASGMVVFDNCDFNCTVHMGYAIHSRIDHRSTNSASADDYRFFQRIVAKPLYSSTYLSDTKVRFTNNRFYRKFHCVPYGDKFIRVRSGAPTEIGRRVVKYKKDAGTSKWVPSNEFVVNLKNPYAPEDVQYSYIHTSINTYNIIDMTIESNDFDCGEIGIDFKFSPTFYEDLLKLACRLTNSNDNIYLPPRARLLINNNIMRSITPSAISFSGVIHVEGRAIDFAAKNNTILAGASSIKAGICMKTNNLEYIDSYDAEDLLYNSATIHDNTILNFLINTDKIDSTTKPTLFSPERIIAEINRTLEDDEDYWDYTFLPVVETLVYSPSVLLAGSRIKIDIQRNQFLKSRGSLRDLTKSGITYTYDGETYTESTTVKRVMMPDFSNAADNFFSGRSIVIVSTGAISTGPDSYTLWRNLIVSGVIRDNNMGALAGDALIWATPNIDEWTTGSKVFDSEDLHDCLFESTGGSGVINYKSIDSHPAEYAHVDLNIKCSGNYYEATFPSINVLHNGYRYDKQNHVFFK